METATGVKSLVYEFEDFRVEVAAFRLTRAGIEVTIEPKALQLLIYLLENRGRLLKKQELLDAVWGDISVTENALTRAITQLRRVLGDNTREPKYIATVPTQGYRFIANVAQVQVQEGYGATANNPVTPPLRAPRESASRPFPVQTVVMWTAMLLVLVVGGVAGYRTLTRRGAPRTGANNTTARYLLQLTFSSGMDVFPSFSPDSRAIVYSSDKSGSYELYMRQLAATGGEMRLTDDKSGNVEAAWSPDGQWIAYHSTKEGGIWLIPQFGGTRRRLTNFGSWPAWSRDGSKIAFESGDVGAIMETELGATPYSTIWTVRVSDGALTQMTHPAGPALQNFGDSSPKWSPNGRQIVYASNGSLKVIDADGSEPKEIESVEEAYDPVFSADGRFIYFLSFDWEGSGIWQVPVDESGRATGAPKKINGSGSGTLHYLAPTGNGALAFSVVNTRDDLYAVVLPKNKNAKLEIHPLTQDTRMRKTIPSFSPDGSRVAFLVYQKGRNGQIWMVNSDGTNQRQMPLESSAFYPAWADANTLTYWQRGNGQAADLREWNLDTGGVTDIFRGHDRMSAMRISPDKKSAVYHKSDNGTMNVWSVSLVNGERRQLTFGSEMVGWPAWSHDGKWIAVETKQGQDTQVAVIPSTGGMPVAVTKETGQNWPYSWSPDDKEISFAGFRNGIWNIFAVSRKTGVERQLTHYEHPSVFVRYPEWSPKGNEIVYEYGNSSANIWLLGPH